jgi:lysophospholipase L1-like esterase
MQMQPRLWFMLACSVLLVTACTAVGERGKTAVSEGGTQVTGREGPARFLALGDSYTIGESVASDQRWPVQLVKALRAEGIEIRPPRIIAKTGWTTDELADAVQAAEFEHRFDFVSLMIGVNNQYRGRGVDNYHEELDQLIERAIQLAGGSSGRVIVISIPDWGVTPYARKDERSASRIAEEIDAFNDVTRELAKRHGTRYVNVTDISRELADDILLVANDGLHPSPQQYRQWTKRILPVAREILGHD